MYICTHSTHYFIIQYTNCTVATMNQFALVRCDAITLEEDSVLLNERIFEVAMYVCVYNNPGTYSDPMELRYVFVHFAPKNVTH